MPLILWAVWRKKRWSEVAHKKKGAEKEQEVCKFTASDRPAACLLMWDFLLLSSFFSTRPTMRTQRPVRSLGCPLNCLSKFNPYLLSFLFAYSECLPLRAQNLPHRWLKYRIRLIYLPVAACPFFVAFESQDAILFLIFTDSFL